MCDWMMGKLNDGMTKWVNAETSMCRYFLLLILKVNRLGLKVCRSLGFPVQSLKLLVAFKRWSISEHTLSDRWNRSKFLKMQSKVFIIWQNFIDCISNYETILFCFANALNHDYWWCCMHLSCCGSKQNCHLWIHVTDRV